MTGIQFVRCGFSVVGVQIISVFVFNLIISGKIAIIAAPNAFSSFRFLKEKLASRIFHLATNNFGLCFAAKENFIDTFWRPNFSIWRLKKKFQSPVGACLKKLILDPETCSPFQRCR